MFQKLVHTQHRSRSRNSRRLAIHPVAVLMFLSITLSPHAVFAHQTLSNNIAHDIEIVVGPGNVDVTVELTFHHQASLVERRRMDRNNDQRIEEAERRSYLNEALEDALRATGLRLAGEALTLIPLHNPRIDVGGVEAVTAAPHTLSFYLFARLEAESGVLTFEDRLWSAAPNTVNAVAHGRDGYFANRHGNGHSCDPSEAIVIPIEFGIVQPNQQVARASSPQRRMLAAGATGWLLVILFAVSTRPHRHKEF